MSATKFVRPAVWKETWFRTMPPSVKCVWRYLNDNCEFYGYFKIDYGLATFQIGMEVNPTLLEQWFKKFIHFISEDEIVILTYFEEQYAHCKDTWSAKIRARQKLETMGYSVIGHKVYPPDTVEENQPVKPVPDASKLPAFEPLITDGVTALYNDLYPRKEGLTWALESLVTKATPKTEIKTLQDLKDFEKAIGNYVSKVVGREEKHIKTFATFAKEWRDWLHPSAGKPKSSDGGVRRTQENLRHLEEISKGSTEAGKNNYLKRADAKSILDAVEKSKTKAVSA